MGLITIKTKEEEKKLYELIKEFARKIVLPRRFKPTKSFDEFKKVGIFGITDHVKDEKTSEVIYDVALPDCYLGFIQYELDHLTPVVVELPVKKGRKSSKHSD